MPLLPSLHRVRGFPPIPLLLIHQQCSSMLQFSYCCLCPPANKIPKTLFSLLIPNLKLLSVTVCFTSIRNLAYSSHNASSVLRILLHNSLLCSMFTLILFSHHSYPSVCHSTLPLFYNFNSLPHIFSLMLSENNLTTNLKALTPSSTNLSKCHHLIVHSYDCT